MPMYRTMKQGLLKEGQKPGTGWGGSGRIEILRCVQGLRKGMAEWYIKFIDLTLENKNQSDLVIYITKRHKVHKQQRYIEEEDYKLLIDRGIGGCAKGPGVKGTFVQPLFNVPLERDITGIYIAKPSKERPLTATTQIHLWCQVLNKSDRDPAEWYPILHEHRKTLEDMFFQRQNATVNQNDGRLNDGHTSTANKLRYLKANAQKAFDRFDEDGSGTVDIGKMMLVFVLQRILCDFV
jgi:hypothetical protein